ncbi:MAG: hypothetical protein NVS4B8_17100 [Herpetosiphon sp.]
MALKDWAPQTSVVVCQGQVEEAENGSIAPLKEWDSYAGTPQKATLWRPCVWRYF